jgi:hypothetical protein
MQPGLTCEWFLVKFEDKYRVRYHGPDRAGFFNATGSITWDFPETDRNIDKQLVETIDRLAKEYAAHERNLREPQDVMMSPVSGSEESEPRSVSVPTSFTQYSSPEYMGITSPRRRTGSRSPSPPAKRRAIDPKQTVQATGQSSDLPESMGSMAAKFADAVVLVQLKPLNSDERDEWVQVGIDPQYFDPGEWKLPEDFIVFRKEGKSAYSEAKYRAASLRFRFVEHPHTPSIDLKLPWDSDGVYETPSKMFRVHNYHNHRQGADGRGYGEYRVKVYYQKSSEGGDDFLYYGILIPLNLLRLILQEVEKS